MPIIKKKKRKTKLTHISNKLTGEDIDMFNERKYEKEKEKEKAKNVCDRHIDGA